MSIILPHVTQQKYTTVPSIENTTTNNPVSRYNFFCANYSKYNFPTLTVGLRPARHEQSSWSEYFSFMLERHDTQYLFMVWSKRTDRSPYMSTQLTVTGDHCSSRTTQNSGEYCFTVAPSSRIRGNASVETSMASLTERAV